MKYSCTKYNKMAPRTPHARAGVREAFFISAKSHYLSTFSPQQNQNFFKLSIVFFRFGVFGAVPARTVARKYSKYKAFLYVGL